MNKRRNLSKISIVRFKRDSTIKEFASKFNFSSKRRPFRARREIRFYLI